MAFFNLEDYQSVQDRVALFWQTYPNGRIHTEIVLINEKEIVIKASVFTDREDHRPATIDFAQESVTAKGVNSTSWVENCATSATGRAISLLGEAFSPKGKRPSKEEMTKVVAKQRDFMAEARALNAAKDLNGLRVVYQDAERAKADANILTAIMGFANKLKE